MQWNATPKNAVRVPDSSMCPCSCVPACSCFFSCCCCSSCCFCSCSSHCSSFFLRFLLFLFFVKFCVCVLVLFFLFSLFFFSFFLCFLIICVILLLLLLQVHCVFPRMSPSCQAATAKPEVARIEEQPSYDRDPGETWDRSRRISGILRAVHSVSVGTHLAIWKVLCLWADQAFISKF